MDNNSFPTKGNLIKSKNTLILSRQGYDLLDKKRNILIREMMSLIEDAKKLQSEIADVYKLAYAQLQNANIVLGIKNVEQIGYAIKEEDSVDIKIRHVMGVEIPMVSFDDKKLKPQYGFSRTNMALDEAYEQFEKAKKMTFRLAEIENAVFRLAVNIKRTQKRANALKNILIPRYELLTKTIQDSLEEKDREDFTRLKVIKSRK